ncbi:MAG: hypothetical protein EOP83_14955 [Verrucomicrobiaceae bacterium]|nr:MAG: hypothetical protein EOP83_14955 [Verrucomicrobiaceae bacterium]
MKSIIIILLAVSALSQAAEKEKVSIEEFGENKVLIGKLGEPFGKVVRVSCRGYVPTEDDKRSKDEGWKDLVEIFVVGDKLLEVPVRIKWSAFLTATVAKPTSDQTLQVWGYETGGFKGTPGEAFQYVPGIADTDFGFVSTFVALKKAEPAKQTK